MDGVFMENGPYTFDRNDHIIRNPYSWNKHSNIVYGKKKIRKKYIFLYIYIFLKFKFFI